MMIICKVPNASAARWAFRSSTEKRLVVILKSVPLLACFSSPSHGVSESLDQTTTAVAVFFFPSMLHLAFLGFAISCVTTVVGDLALTGGGES